MSKKPVDFVSAMKSYESTEGVHRRPKAPVLPTESSVDQQEASPVSRAVQSSRVGKVSIGVWVDPAVRKQLAQLALDYDRDQGELIAEGLNLLFERYGRPPIARVR